MKELIQERTGASPGSSGEYFKLNPDVADLPEKFSVTHDGVRLMVLGGITKGGGGCACPENALLKALLAHLLVLREDAVIADMEAGIEHLGRATVAAVDALIVVVEPGRRSIEIARNSPSGGGDRDPEDPGRRKQSPDGRTPPVPRRSHGRLTVAGLHFVSSGIGAGGPGRPAGFRERAGGREGDAGNLSQPVDAHRPRS